MLRPKADIDSIQAQSKLKIEFLQLLPSIGDTEKHSNDRQRIVTTLENLLDLIEDPETVGELRGKLEKWLERGGKGDRARELRDRMAEINSKIKGANG